MPQDEGGVKRLPDLSLLIWTWGGPARWQFKEAAEGRVPTVARAGGPDVK